MKILTHAPPARSTAAQMGNSGMKKTSVGLATAASKSTSITTGSGANGIGINAFDITGLGGAGTIIT